MTIKDTLIADVAFEIIWGGDRFDKFDVRQIIKENNFDKDEIKEEVKKWVLSHWPSGSCNASMTFVNKQLNLYFG